MLALLLPGQCIDQDNIEVNLRCLPVFLSGCKSLLVLAGSTYTSRLWCVTELFVWLRVGGAKEGIRVFHLSADAEKSLNNFDAGKANCFKPKDKQHLLAVIESGFGDLVPFNKLVRGLFAEAGAVQADSRQIV